MDVMAPLNQTMNIQLDVCAVVRHICWDTAMCSGTAPNPYHTNAVMPAHNAAELKSRILCDHTTFNDYSHEKVGGIASCTATNVCLQDQALGTAGSTYDFCFRR